MASPSCGTGSACPGPTASGERLAFMGLFHGLAAIGAEVFEMGN